jgi:hypothetical protein
LRVRFADGPDGDPEHHRPRPPRKLLDARDRIDAEVAHDLRGQLRDLACRRLEPCLGVLELRFRAGPFGRRRWRRWRGCLVGEHRARRQGERQARTVSAHSRRMLVLVFMGIVPLCIDIRCAGQTQRTSELCRADLHQRVHQPHALLPERPFAGGISPGSLSE